MAGVLDMVMNDQVSYFEDFLRPQHIVPFLVGLVLLIVGIIVLFTAGNVAGSGDGSQTEEQKKGMYAGFGVGGSGLLTIIVVMIIMFIRHPRAVIEQDIVETVF